MSVPRILNVDDKEPSRYVRSRVLRTARFEVDEAATGAETLELLSRHPDLVLLDVNLPDIAGTEICRRIKSDARYASIIVLHISASAVEAPQASAALDTGADSYLVEPVHPDVLVATIKALLRLRSAEQQLREANDALGLANAALTETNSALQRSNEDLEHFAYLASHDLKEPLRTITTHLQLITRSMGERLNQREKQLFDFVLDASRRMGALIEDVLSYSRAGREDLAMRPVALSDAVTWALKNLQESVLSTSAGVEIRDLPLVWGDGVQLGRLFQNLIANAIKYHSGAEAPRIIISAELDADGKYLIHVADNGLGIPRDRFDYVFRPFKRLHGRDVAGTGIGLALCRRIVEAHGGTIWVDSEVGRGSTFSFSLLGASTSTTLGNS